MLKMTMTLIGQGMIIEKEADPLAKNTPQVK